MEEEKKAAPAKQLTQHIATVAKDVLRPSYGGVMRSADSVLTTKGGNRGLAIYDDLARDGRVYSKMHKRKMAVIGRPWIVEPASEAPLDVKGADMVREHLSKLRFDRVSYHLLGAILKGREHGEIMWAREGNILRPTQVKAKNARRFMFDDNGELRLLTPAAPVKGEELPPRKFITHIFGGEDDNPHGQGLGHQLWWPVFFKRQGLSFWLQFLDKFGAPTAIGEYEPGVNVNELEEALARIAHDAGVALPKGAAVKLLEATRGGTGTHDTLVRYMDEEIGEIVLGDGGSGRGSGGELSNVANLRNEVRLELVQADADLLSDTLAETLIKWDIELNMPSANPPRVYRDVSEEEDLEARAERDSTLSEMGFEPTEEYVRETYGGQWTKKKPTKPTDEKPPAPAAEFAEADAAMFPDQAALDQAIDDIPPEALQAQMQEILGGLLDDLEKAGGYVEALNLLAARYPKMSAPKLEKLLAQAMFAAELWGVDSAEAEAAG